MRILSICGALAAGEYLAACYPTFSDLWPLLLLLTILIALFGYGFKVRGWSYVAVFCLGAALHLISSLPSEAIYREKPWLRNRQKYTHYESVDPVTKAVRKDLLKRVSLGLNHDPLTASLNRAILLGERKQLPHEIKSMFVESGTMHIFAISGLHIMAVMKVLLILTALFYVPRRFSGLVAVPFLWGYVHVIGWSPSAIRAAMMISIYCLAPIFWRRANGLRAWALTFLAVHIVNPQMITDVGSMLSFTVMLAIVLTLEYMRGLAEWKMALILTLVAWAAGVPISAHIFGRVTPGGILANLVLIAVAGWTVILGMIGLVISFVSETLAIHLNNMSALITKLMTGVADSVSRIPWMNLEVDKWPLWECALWYVMVILIVFVLPWAHSRRLPY